MDASTGRRSWLLLLVLMAMLLTACGPMLVRPGQSFRPTPTPAPTFDPELTGFDGLVVDEDGEPIAGVHIQLRQSGRRGTAATTAAGTFFDRGHAGDIGITARLEGYETVETTVKFEPKEIAEIEIVMAATEE